MKSFKKLKRMKEKEFKRMKCRERKRLMVRCRHLHSERCRRLQSERCRHLQSERCWHLQSERCRHLQSERCRHLQSERCRHLEWKVSTPTHRLCWKGGHTDIRTDWLSDQTDRLHEFHSYMELKTLFNFFPFNPRKMEDSINFSNFIIKALDSRPKQQPQHDNRFFRTSNHWK